MCHYESLKDGTLTISDIAHMNNYLDCQEWNQYIAEQKAKNQ